MSRLINTSDSLSFVPTGYSDNTFNSSYYQNLDNGLSGSNDTTYAAFAMRNTSYHIYYDFSVSGIPSSATITSVTCSVKGYVYSSSYYPSVRLYSGTTAKGSASNITSTSSSNVQNITAGTWTTVSELENARLYIVVAARYSRGSLSNSYFRFYGATLTVNYSISGTEYEVTFSNSTSDVTTDPSTSTYVFQGGNQEIVFSGITDLNDYDIKDNNVDISSSLVYTPVLVYNEVTANPSSLDSYQGYSSPTNPGNGCTGTSSSTRAELNIRGTSAGSYLLYSFNITGIPNNATDISVSCSVRAYISSTSSSITNKAAQLYAGSTAKGSPYTIPTSDSTYSLDTGTWSVSELSSLKLKLSATYSNSSNYYIYFYGADLTITYGVPGSDYVYIYTISNIAADHVITINNVSSETLPIRVKQNGTWVTAKKLFVKQNGSWVQSTTIKVKNNGTWK